jgi:hypothetical protein
MSTAIVIDVEDESYGRRFSRRSGTPFLEKSRPTRRNILTPHLEQTAQLTR